MSSKNDISEYQQIIDFIEYYQKEFDINVLDQHVSIITENQNQSLIERKRLAEETKKFKTLPDEEKTSHLPSLLKSYQNEIDRLTKRSKSTEIQYISLYSAITKSPDPSIVHDYASDLLKDFLSVVSLKNENEKLLKELDSYHELTQEHMILKRKIESLNKHIKSLESKHEESLKDEINTTLSIKENEFEKIKILLNDKISSLTTENSNLCEMIESLKSINQEKSNTHAKLEQQTTDELQAKQSEIDFLTSEVDHLSTKIMSLERQLKVIGTSEISYTHDDIKTLLTEKDLSLKELQQLVSNLEEKSLNDKARFEKEQKSLVKEVKFLKDQLKNEQENPRSIEHYSKTIKQLNETIQSLNSDIEEKESRILLYEEENRRIQLKDGSSGSSSSSLPSTPTSSRGNIHIGDENELINALKQQKERYKERKSLFIKENQLLKENVNSLSQKMTQLSNDNVNLYKKIKYLESESKKKSNEIKKRTNHANSDDEIHVDISHGIDPFEEKYKVMYDETLSPFADFIKGEKEEKFNQLNSMEKILFKFTSFFMANKHTRLILFIYTLSLHFLVFIITYNMASSTK